MIAILFYLGVIRHIISGKLIQKVTYCTVIGVTYHVLFILLFPFLFNLCNFLFKPFLFNLNVP